MAVYTYQIYLELKGSKPKIWRRLLVPSDVSLSDFHKVLQTVMGWTNSHLHQFIADRQHYEPPAPKDEFWESYGEDYTGLTLDDILEEENDKITYEYDFGDGWEHTIKLEQIVSNDKNIKLPKCIAGAMACPPEDCGGMWGFQEFKKIIKNPKHPEHDSYLKWIGGSYDPEAFDKEQINESLSDKNYGVIEW